MNDSTRDWPETLKLNFEASRLAPMIYYCQHQVYGGSGLLWDGLSPASKHLYIMVAADLIKTFKPERAITPKAATALRVVKS